MRSNSSAMEAAELIFKKIPSSMKSIFDEESRANLITRVDSLTEHSTAQWGKMNVYQMIKHCSTWEEMVQGKHRYKQMFMGRIFGRMVLKSVLKDERPLKHNTPTIPDLIIREKGGNISTQKAEWISRIQEYSTFSNPGFVHVFFGKMTEQQVGQLVYKHIDHHLRQFNA
jgi:hypothetical protein